jgi:hypothetical protein
MEQPLETSLAMVPPMPISMSSGCALITSALFIAMSLMTERFLSQFSPREQWGRRGFRDVSRVLG